MKIRTCLLAVAAVASSSMTAVGNEINALLEINIANLSEVTISSTGAPPAVYSAATSAWDGVLLTGLFAEAQAYREDLPLSALTASGSAEAYNRAQSSDSDLDLNLYYGNIMQNHEFAPPIAAFAGDLTLNLTGRALNTNGFGDIKENRLDAPVIGQWVFVNGGDQAASAEVASADAKAIAEPASFALLVFGLTAIGVGRSRASAVV